MSTPWYKTRKFNQLARLKLKGLLENNAPCKHLNFTIKEADISGQYVGPGSLGVYVFCPTCHALETITRKDFAEYEEYREIREIKEDTPMYQREDNKDFKDFKDFKLYQIVVVINETHHIIIDKKVVATDARNAEYQAEVDKEMRRLDLTPDQVTVIGHMLGYIDGGSNKIG